MFSNVDDSSARRNVQIMGYVAKCRSTVLLGGLLLVCVSPPPAQVCPRAFQGTQNSRCASSPQVCDHICIAPICTLLFFTKLESERPCQGSLPPEAQGAGVSAGAVYS